MPAPVCKGLAGLTLSQRARPTLPQTRDADLTRARILKAARNEFMRHGYSGARIERISRAGRSSDRMIYYYFGSKEALYIHVLESVYAELGAAESRLALDESRPLEALRTLIAFTWNYYLAHPEFVALLSNENLQRGRHITKSLSVVQLSRPVLDILGRILDEGARQGLFRSGLDVRHVYLTMAALGYFYLSNRYTLSSFLGADLMQRERCDAWFEEMTRVLLASVVADGPAAVAAAAPRHNAASPIRRTPGKH
jgi:AcrR family transcriptional regulator